jgi:hypothetical protein
VNVDAIMVHPRPIDNGSCRVLQPSCTATRRGCPLWRAGLVITSLKSWGIVPILAKSRTPSEERLYLKRHV